MRVLPIALVALLLAGCATAGPSAPAEPTTQSTPSSLLPSATPAATGPTGAPGSPTTASVSTLASTSPAGGGAPAASASTPPSEPDAGPTPGGASAGSTAAPVPVGTPTSYPSVAAEPSLYLVSVGDGGPLGCGDTAVAAIRVPRSGTPVRDAMTQLLGMHDLAVGQSGLTNNLALSDLRYRDGRYDAATGMVEVWLDGELRTSGVCDIPRVSAQLELTALSAAQATSVLVRVNDLPIQEVLSQRGRG